MIIDTKDITSRDAFFQKLWDRMDDDRDLVRLAYEYLDAKNRPVDGVLNVTLNTAAVFAHSVTSVLKGAIMQTVVEGAANKTQTATLEAFSDDLYPAADELLQNRLFPSTIQSAWADQVCFRGWIASRVWLYEEDGMFYPDILPLDCRYLSYWIDNKGLSRVAYKMNRGADSLESEYGDEFKGVYTNIMGQNLQVIEVIDREKEEVYVNTGYFDNMSTGRLIKTTKHGFGYVPVNIVNVSNGFLLMDDGYLEHIGESIFFLDRLLYAELNRLASICQTKAEESIRPTYTIPTADLGGEPVKYPPPSTGVVETPAGTEMKVLQKEDVNRAFQIAHGDVSAAIQNGSLSNIDYGNITFPMSAVAISAMTGLRDKVHIPRLQALAQIRQMTTKMGIRQYSNMRLKDKRLGGTGKKREYDPRSLGNPDGYVVTYRFMTKTREQEIANMAVAQAARGLIPDEDIRETILMVQDPQQTKARLDYEQAERDDPFIRLERRVFMLIEQDKDLEAELTLQQLETMLRQRAMGQVQPPQQESVESKGNVNLLLPLLAAGNRTGGMGGTRNKAEVMTND